jgi:hypothetical protein
MNIFSLFEYQMLYSLYQFVTYLLTLPGSVFRCEQISDYQENICSHPLSATYRESVHTEMYFICWKTESQGMSFVLFTELISLYHFSLEAHRIGTEVRSLLVWKFQFFFILTCKW